MDLPLFCEPNNKMIVQFRINSQKEKHKKYYQEYAILISIGMLGMIAEKKKRYGSELSRYWYWIYKFDCDLQTHTYIYITV